MNTYITTEKIFNVNNIFEKLRIFMINFQKFTDEVLRLSDVYFVTYSQVINWIKRPTPVVQLKKFHPWQCGYDYFQESDIACGKPNTCKLQSKVSEHDKYMITCTECPKTYPWIRNEFGVE